MNSMKKELLRIIENKELSKSNYGEGSSRMVIKLNNDRVIKIPRLINFDSMEDNDRLIALQDPTDEVPIAKQFEDRDTNRTYICRNTRYLGNSQISNELKIYNHIHENHPTLLNALPKLYEHGEVSEYNIQYMVLEHVNQCVSDDRKINDKFIDIWDSMLNRHELSDNKKLSYVLLAIDIKLILKRFGKKCDNSIISLLWFLSKNEVSPYECLRLSNIGFTDDGKLVILDVGFTESTNRLYQEANF